LSMGNDALLLKGNFDMTQIETKANPIAVAVRTAIQKADDAIDKARQSELEKIMKVIDTKSVTKEDLKPIRVSLIEYYTDRSKAKGGDGKGAANAASRVTRLFKVAFNLDKKLCETWDVKTPDDGKALLHRLIAENDIKSIKALAEALTPPKAENEGEGDGETDDDGGEIKDAAVQNPLELLAGYFANCKKHSHTPDEVFNLIQQVSTNRNAFDKIWKAVPTKHS
jgi:hypothetical protein